MELYDIAIKSLLIKLTIQIQSYLVSKDTFSDKCSISYYEYKTLTVGLDHKNVKFKRDEDESDDQFDIFVLLQVHSSIVQSQLKRLNKM